MENRGDETGEGDEEREDCVLGNTRLGKVRQLPYSCPSLKRAKTEELISRPFVGEN